MKSDITPIELSALGAMLSPETRNDAVFSAPEALFSSELGKTVLKGIKTLYGEGYVVSPDALSVALQTNSGYSQEDADAIVVGCVSGAANPKTLPFILKSLGVARVRSLTKTLAEDLTKEAGSAIIGDVLGRLSTFVHEVSSMETNRAETYEAAIRALATMDKVKYFVPDMYPLDNILQIDEGTVCYIGGRSASGKTAFGLNLMYNIARAGHKVGIIEIEMRRKPLAARLNGIMSRVNTRRAMKGETEAAEREHMLHSLEQNRAIIERIRGIEPSSFHADMVRPTIERWREEWGCEIVLLDYVQLLGAKGSNDTEIVKNASRAITEAAKSTGIPIVGLSQARRSEGVVTMQDFKQSSQLEHDADTMVVLNPVDGFTPGDDVRQVYCDIVKSRNGGTGKDILNYHLPSQTFEHSGQVAKNTPKPQDNAY